MYQEDYILRHIRLFTQFLAKIFGLVESNDLNLALEMLRQAFRDYLGVDLDTFITIPEERILDFLTFGELGKLGVSKSSFAVALLKEVGLIYQAKNKPEIGSTYLEKSLALMLEVQLASEEVPDFPEFTPTVDDLLKITDIEMLSLDTRATLVFYLERRGEFLRAAQILDGMLVQQPKNREVIDLGISFYEYLLGEEEGVLVNGGVTRTDVAAGLKKWRTLVDSYA